MRNDKQKNARAEYGGIDDESHIQLSREIVIPDFLRTVGQATDRSYLPFFGEDRCVKTDAATVLTPFGVEGLLSNLLAIDATRADVCSFGGNLRVAI